MEKYHFPKVLKCKKKKQMSMDSYLVKNDANEVKNLLLNNLKEARKILPFYPMSDCKPIFKI